MRIGLFSDTYIPEVNGVASSTHILREALEAHGHTVYVITTKGKNDPQDDHVLRFSGIELKSLYNYKMAGPLHLTSLHKVKNMKLDVIHAQTEFGVGIFARICSKSMRIPLVSTYHTTYEDYTHYVNFIHAKTVDRVAKKLVAKLSKLYGDSGVEVIAPSEKTKAMLEGYGLKRPIHVIPTGLKLERFKPLGNDTKMVAQIRQQVGLKEGEILATFVGRIAEEKSLDLVLQGFAEAKKQALPVRLMVVGGGPDLEKMKQLAKTLGIEDCCTFVGKVNPADVPQYYHAAHIFISASLTETQGMTFVEALASGIPVCARPDEVLNDIVLEGKTGYFFKTPQDLATCLKQYSDLSQEARKQMATACLEQAAPYDSEVFYTKVMKVYERAIAKYENLYVIDQTRAKGDYIQLVIESPEQETIKVLVSLDTYVSKGYRKQAHLTEEEVEELQVAEESVKAYQSCLRKIAVMDRTRKEMYDWLTQNTELEIEAINNIIDKLEDLGYIDDQNYAKHQCANMRLALAGNNKIIRFLKKKGISQEIIETTLADAGDHDEIAPALEWATRMKDTIKEKSLRMKKKTLREKLAIQGYNTEVIDEVMGQLSFVEDEQEEIDNLRHIAAKAARRYKRKYTGVELRNRVYRYCATMGFSNNDIYVVLDEMRWDDEPAD